MSYVKTKDMPKIGRLFTHEPTGNFPEEFRGSRTTLGVLHEPQHQLQTCVSEVLSSACELMLE